MREVEPRHPLLVRRLGVLRESMTDRPHHAAYLATMEDRAVRKLVERGRISDRWETSIEVWRAMCAVPIPAGVSARVAEAIVSDLSWITGRMTMGFDQHDDPFPAAYTARRELEAKWAADREVQRRKADEDVQRTKEERRRR